MDETIVIYHFDGVTRGLGRSDSEILRDYLFGERTPERFELGGRLNRALSPVPGSPPLELTLEDVPVLRAVLDGAETRGGLLGLQQAVGSEPYRA